MDFIPVNEPLLDGNEKKYLCECIDTRWISSEGPFVREFEQKMSSTVHRKYGIAVSNGTAALEVAVRALGIGRGNYTCVYNYFLRNGCNKSWRRSCAGGQ